MCGEFRVLESFRGNCVFQMKWQIVRCEYLNIVLAQLDYKYTSSLYFSTAVLFQNDCQVLADGATLFAAKSVAQFG